MGLWWILTSMLFAAPLDAQVLWQELFNYPDGTTTAGDNNLPAGADWTVSCPTCICCNDWYEVRNNKLEGRDTNGPAVWTSESIDISSCSSGVGFMMDLSSSGSLEACTGGCGCNCIDWIKVEYSLDGGGFTSLSSANGGTCSQSCGTGTFVTLGNITAFSFYSPCPLVGSTLVIRVSVQTWAGSEYLRFDRVSVMCNGCNPLPIELASFTAEQEDKGIVLNWTTMSERNTDYFEIRSSMNGLDFSSDGTVKASGTSITSRTYQYTDHAPQRGTHYYRLLWHDFDGTADSSGVISVHFEPSGTVPLAVFPNPANHFLIVKSPWPDERELYCELIDHTGRKVRRTLISGKLQRMDIKGLTPGIYAIVVHHEGGIATARWVKR